MRQQRSDQMQEVRDRIKREFEEKFLEKEVKRYRKNGVPAELFLKRMKSLPLRAYFIYIIYQYTYWEKYKRKPSENKIFSTYLPLLSELIICIQYHYNLLYDDKNELDKKERNKQLAYGNSLTNWQYNYIRSFFYEKGYRPKKIRVVGKLMQTVSNILSCVDDGQILEKEVNNYSSYLQYTFVEKDVFGEKPQEIFSYMPNIEQLFANINDEIIYKKRSFLVMYFKRIMLTNVTLFLELSNFIVDELKLKDATRIKEIAVLCGIISQLVNDIADNIPSKYSLKSSVKISSDAFSDLRNGNITLPLMYVLLYDEETSTKENGIKKYLEDNKGNFLLTGRQTITKEQEKVFFQEISNSHSLYKTRQITRIFQQQAKELINEKNIYAPMLTDIFKMAAYNKYAYVIINEKENKPKHKEYKETEHYKKSKQFIDKKQATIK